MRLKLGAGLAERNLAPHVFETWAEAQAFSTVQPHSPDPAPQSPNGATIVY
jgi:propionate CoA-transferase